MRKLFAALLFLLPVQADATTMRVWITEFATGRVEAAAPFANLPASVQQQTLDLNGGVAKRSANFAASTRFIRIVCEVQCAISASVLANTSSIFMPALRPEYFGVTGGTSISVIATPSQ